MIDASLERHLTDARELQALWRRFRDFFSAAIRQEPLDTEKEMEFLKVKSRIAMLHDSYLECIKSGQKIAQNVIALVGRSITLKHVAQLSIAESKKFEIEWHESFLQMEETIGQLEEERARLSQITPAKYRAMNTKKRISHAINVTIHSTVFKLGIVATVLVAIIGLLVYFDAVGRMYANPSTKEFAIKLMAILRVAQPDLEYGDLSEAMAQKLPGNKPADFSHFTTAEGKQEAKAALVKFQEKNQEFDATADLKAAIQFAVQDMNFMPDTRQPAIKISYFRFEKSETTKDIFKRYEDFREATGNQRRSNPPGNVITFMRKANVIIIMESANSHAREWMREKLFKFKLDTDS